MFEIFDATESGRNRESFDDISWDSKKTSGAFNTDFNEICASVLNVQAHPKIIQSKGDRVQCQHFIVDPCSTKATMLALSASKNICSLYLNGCALNDVSLNLIRIALPNTSITTLAVDYNNTTGCNDVTALCSLASVETLTSLSLRGNQLGAGENVSILCRILKTNSSIKSLSLYRNKLGNQGTIAISRLLRFNKTLKNISLSANGIGCIGLRELLTSITRYQLDQDGIDSRNMMSNITVEQEDDDGKKKKKKKKSKKNDNAQKLDEILEGGVCEKDKDGNDIEGSEKAVVGTICRGNTEVVCLDLSCNFEMGVADGEGSEILKEFVLNKTNKDDLLLGGLNTLDLNGCGLAEEQRMMNFLKEVNTERSVSRNESK
jgi:hypothetical protein